MIPGGASASLSRIRLALAAVALLAARPEAFALGKPDWDLELDPYYSALGLTLPFLAQADSQDVEGAEMRTYLDMLKRGLVPRYLVIEGSVNPLPIAGVLLRGNAPGFYRDMQLSDNLNLVEAVTAGFEEPYALSLFLGKVIDFAPGQRDLARSRKGYVGYLASGGNYHIMQGIMVPDNWLELEAKVKGDARTAERKLSWSFRGGRRVHSNADVRGTYYLGLRRSRTDFKPGPWSWLLSSAIEYRMDLSQHGLEPLGHFFLVEKNIPVPRREWTLSLGVGYLWQSAKKYTGELSGRRRVGSESQLLFRPNLKF